MSFNRITPRRIYDPHAFVAAREARRPKEERRQAAYDASQAGRPPPTPRDAKTIDDARGSLSPHSAENLGRKIPGENFGVEILHEEAGPFPPLILTPEYERRAASVTEAAMGRLRATMRGRG